MGPTKNLNTGSDRYYITYDSTSATSDAIMVGNTGIRYTDYSTASSSTADISTNVSYDGVYFAPVRKETPKRTPKLVASKSKDTEFVTRYHFRKTTHPSPGDIHVSDPLSFNKSIMREGNRKGGKLPTFLTRVGKVNPRNKDFISGDDHKYGYVDSYKYPILKPGRIVVHTAYKAEFIKDIHDYLRKHEDQPIILPESLYKDYLELDSTAVVDKEFVVRRIDTKKQVGFDSLSHVTLTYSPTTSKNWLDLRNADINMGNPPTKWLDMIYKHLTGLCQKDTDGPVWKISMVPSHTHVTAIRAITYAFRMIEMMHDTKVWRDWEKFPILMNELVAYVPAMLKSDDEHKKRLGSWIKAEHREIYGNLNGAVGQVYSRQLELT